MERKRIVITGMGCISPVGNTPESAWDAIKNGRSGIKNISQFDTSRVKVKIAGEITDFNAELYGIQRKSLRKMARFTQFAVAAAHEAVRDCGIDADKLKEEKCGVIVGCCLGGTEAFQEAIRKLYDPSFGPEKISPFVTPLMINNEAAANVSMHFGINGLSWTMGTACASGTDALALALDLIRSGRIEMSIAGGTESSITEFSVASYDQLQALAKNYNDCPEKSCRPFDKAREGFVIAEGSVMFVLEELEHAKKRGARIYAELLGTGASCDAYHITKPLEDGSIAALGFQEAISDAGIRPEQIDYYNAHGTSTVVNDMAESSMLKTVFGEHSRKIRISSTKSITGHMIGAAGAMEAMVCIKAINDNFVPPTINLDNPDIENGCDLDYTPNKGVSCTVNTAASGSLGFGGHNAFAIFGKYD